MLSPSDQQLALVMNAAKLLSPAWRDDFMRSVASRLSDVDHRIRQRACFRLQLHSFAAIHKKEALMLKQRKRDDNDDFDKRGVLKDGRPQLIHHQPGFIVTDALTADEHQRICDAYDDYERDLTTAWKGGAT
jgi:hypothetical protein